MTDRNITPSSVVKAKYPPDFPNSFGAAYRYIVGLHPSWQSLDSEAAMTQANRTSNLLERQVLNLLASEAAAREDQDWRASKGRVPRVAEADMHVRDEKPANVIEMRPRNIPPVRPNSPPCTIGAIETVLESYNGELGPASGFNLGAILKLDATVLDFRKACEWVVLQVHTGKPISNRPALVFTTLRRMMGRMAQ
jgi:hypothetical protein